MMKGLAITLVVAGLFLCLVAAYQVVDREHYQALEQQQLEALLDAPPGADAERAALRVAQTAEGARRRAAAREAWGRLEIPRLGVSVVLDEGIDAATLRRSVGHLPGTPFPGEPGNVVLAAHRDGLFRPLRLVESGDVLKVRTPDGDFAYEVTSLQVVRPEQTEVLRPAAVPQLTLVTCYPFFYVGPAPERYVVKAREVADTSAARSR